MTSKLTWHKGPPPHVGWWNASTTRSTIAWRWWDGSEWSAGVADYDNADSAALDAVIPAAPHEYLNIEWTDHYPKNARVPRIDPNKERPETMNVTLRWATPNADSEIAYQARVSNPDNQSNPEIAKLLNYCMRHGHVSPFEMANMCVQIDTTRDIARQILRHRSFSFQEFSQRYQDATVLGGAQLRECRVQDEKNRQNSLPCSEGALAQAWADAQQRVIDVANAAYIQALAHGVAKEQARALLPEGLTPSRLYMNGTMRSWIHYLRQRLDPSTQKEHRMIAVQVLAVLRSVAPVTAEAFFSEVVGV